MSVRSRFCRTLSKAQEEEMQNFIDAYGKRDIEKAASVVESLGILGELNEFLCEPKRRLRKRI